jgi:hypothetical protein
VRLSYLIDTKDVITSKERRERRREKKEEGCRR